MQEIPESIIRRARVVVDHHVSALEEAGDLLQPLQEGRIERSHFETELGHVLLGLSQGRSGTGEVTVFKSVGVAIQDLYAAAAAFQNICQHEEDSSLP
jgi:ornithine cyclodeaminase